MGKRENFKSSKGFILACVGAAIGLGNIWMFPYRMGSNGGAVFLIPYLFFVLILGTTGLITEFSFGRLFSKGNLGGTELAFEKKGFHGGKILGAIPVMGLFGIFVFYNIVVGWIIKYFSISISGKFKEVNLTSYFESFAGSPESIIWNLIAIIITVIIVWLGVVKGIEKINKIIMPAMFFILLILAIRSLTLDGAIEGVKFLLVPNWEYLFKIKTWVNALGQAFFTVSLTGCCLVVYGSYTKKEFNIPKAAVYTAIFDTLAAILSGFVIMPAVFACNLDPMAGPPLLFITVPTIFKTIPGGQILGEFFFLSIFLAAISSSIAMLEGPCESLMYKFNISRRKSITIIALVGFLLSIPLDLSMNNFNNFTNFITIILSPIGALITMIVFYYVLNKDEVLKEINTGSEVKLGDKFYFFGKYVFVFITVVIIVLGIILGGIG
ncbi:sodium-dependent transporter [Clostridium sp. Ade.TY]|uniref:sodium-dependent transporter n=1 Tax=Clostridium sp. Ade.TY TaxID=1391647 RepID=UPI000415EA94|nr:sodium-dependent transporter [Clostridium sp. Ade.TY]